MACTGIEFCKLAVTETKHRARWLVEELEGRLPGLADRVRINLNGCPNSCARFQLADIGLQGAMVRGNDGERVEVPQLGEHLGEGARFVSPTATPGVSVRRDWVESTARTFSNKVAALRRVRGSPLETPGGWLVFTHGVGPMLVYSIGAILLDLEDPTRVLARLPVPLMVPDDSERDGFVPNVLYSCGALLHRDVVVLSASATRPSASP